MKKEDIKLDDIHRILFGQAPPEFLIEVFIRTLIIFLFLLVAVKALGKRMKGQLTITEMAVMVTLGAIVAVPMQIADRGILQGLLILIVIVLLQRLVGWLGVRYRGIEYLTQGKICMLVKNGVLQLQTMKQAKISRQELFSMLREDEIYNLGRVDRLYLEACGLVSVYRSKDEHKPGLPVLPPSDQKILGVLPMAGDHVHACCNCGLTVPMDQGNSCSNCGSNEWTKAII